MELVTIAEAGASLEQTAVLQFLLDACLNMKLINVHLIYNKLLVHQLFLMIYYVILEFLLYSLKAAKTLSHCYQMYPVAAQCKY